MEKEWGTFAFPKHLLQLALQAASFYCSPLPASPETDNTSGIKAKASGG